VTLEFAPGGTQHLALCDDHAWDMYMAVVQWFSHADTRHQPKGTTVDVKHGDKMMEGLAGYSALAR
jgi:hypothetical protein